MSGNRFKFWLLAACLAAGAAYSFWYAFKAWARNRIIEDTPTSRVRSAAQGYVELNGRSLPPPTLMRSNTWSGTVNSILKAWKKPMIYCAGP